MNTARRPTAVGGCGYRWNALILRNYRRRRRTSAMTNALAIVTAGVVEWGTNTTMVAAAVAVASAIRSRRSHRVRGRNTSAMASPLRMVATGAAIGNSRAMVMVMAARTTAATPRASQVNFFSSTGITAGSSPFYRVSPALSLADRDSAAQAGNRFDLMADVVAHGGIGDLTQNSCVSASLSRDLRSNDLVLEAVRLSLYPFSAPSVPTSRSLVTEGWSEGARSTSARSWPPPLSCSAMA